MSRVFIAYKFTGEDTKRLKYILNGIKDSLEYSGHIITCSFHFEEYFREQCFTADQIYKHMLKKQEESDIFMVFIKSRDRSKGMLMESKKAIELGQKYVVVSKKGIYIPEFHENAQEIITFNSYPELFQKLRKWKVK